MSATDTYPTTTAPNSVGASRTRVIWLLLAAAFVAILNETTMGVAIPHLITDLHITAVDAQWLTTAFMLTMGVVIPVTGFLLRRFTTRQMFIAAMSLFSLGTAVAVVAPGFPVLLIARVVQASGTAIMMPLLMTTIMTLVPAASRGRMMGRVSLVIALAPAIGPTMSGLLLDTLGWRWIFGIVLPIALVALFVGARWMVNIGENTHAPIDVLSVILSALGFGGLVFGLSQIGSGHGGADEAAASTSSPLVMIVSLTVAVIALAGLIWRQMILQRTDNALLDLRVFRSGNFTLAISHMTLLSAAFFGVITLLPLYMQTVLGISSLDTGLAVLPGALLMGLAGPVIGRIYDARGPRLLLVPGTVLAIGVLWLFSTFGDGTSLWLIVIAQTVLSLGLAMSFTPLMTSAMGSLTPHLYSYGSAILSTIQQVAGAAGVAVLVTTMTAVTAAAEAGGASETAAGAQGAQTAFLVATFMAVPLLVSAFFVRKTEAAEGAPAGH
ncbi:DHA2 family efflux MFS transporter permease subunit [Microbacterium sp. bgisy189]|uniref:DHA2 family efflux MFS transporter permease subunit n=1 Tax=Microbacterium sp. bgisy189 TaxID=3413798 RepID=UPI003EBB730D